MGFTAYRTAPFEHTHENYVFNQLYDCLKAHWQSQEDTIFLLGNVYIDGSEIDALVIKRNAIIVIDFKDYGGELTFSENGKWIIDNKEVRGGNKPNPYLQLRANKFTLLNYLESQINLQTAPNLGHIACLCLFHQKITFDQTSLPVNISRWFHIADITSIVRLSDSIVSKEINLSATDTKAIIAKMNCPQYYPDGNPVEVKIPTFDPPTSFSKALNAEQENAICSIDRWLNNTENTVLALAGPFYSGKTKILQSALRKIKTLGKNPILLAPNARSANRYETKGIPNVKSIYSWLYSKTYTLKDNLIKLHPIAPEPINETTDILIILAAQLIGDDLFEMDTVVYGSGHILTDLLDSFLQNSPDNSDETPSAVLSLPKILIIGDSYKLTNGDRNKNLLTCQIFQSRSITTDFITLDSQDRDDEAPVELLDFQIDLIVPMKDKSFRQLPKCQQGTIKTLQKGERTENIITDISQWPHQAIYLCSTNEKANKVNSFVRQKTLEVHEQSLLVPGDIVDLRNRTLGILPEGQSLTDSQWIWPGEFLKVVQAEPEVKIHSRHLQGRKKATFVKIAEATIECYNGILSTIWYFPDYLFAEKPEPELQIDQFIVLQILAREDVKKSLAKEREKLDSIGEEYGKESDAYKEKVAAYREAWDKLIARSPYLNVARLRFAYALTVHRAQNYNPIPKVFLDCSPMNEGDNIETDKYFRWLYTATTCTSDSLYLIDYPERHLLYKTCWEFGSSRVAPIIFKRKIYYNKDRVPTDAELAIPFPTGFSSPEPRLLAFFLTICDLIQSTEWRVEGITQHNYKERYFFTNKTSEVTFDFNYNGNYDVFIGTSNVLSGDIVISKEIQALIQTQPIFKDKNIEIAVEVFSEHIKEKLWKLIDVDEKNYKAFVIVEHEAGKMKLELNVPSSDSSISKKGIISSVKVIQADSEEVLNTFKKDFSND